MSARSMARPALFFIIASACSSSLSSFKTTWLNPSTAPVEMTGKKVVVVAINLPNTMRMGVEAAVADELRVLGAHAMGSYQFLPLANTVESAKAKLYAEGVDSAFVFHIVDNEQKLWVKPGTDAPGKIQSYWEWGGGWGDGMSAEISTKTPMYVETLVYSVRRDQLAWSGVSVSTNPEDVGSFCRELVRSAVSAMKRTGRLI